MADSKSFDAILGVSKKMINRDELVDQNNQNGQAKDKISSAINRLKEKSQELSDRKLDEMTADEPMSNSGKTYKELKESISLVENYTTKEKIEESTENSTEEIIEEIIEKSTDENIEESTEEQIEESVSNENNKENLLVEHLQSEIDFLKQQIEVKDSQLDKKDELILNFQVLLKSEQDTVLRLESKMTKEDKEESNINESKGWLVKLFGKRTR